MIASWRKDENRNNNPIKSVIARRDDSRQCQLSNDILDKPGCRQIPRWTRAVKNTIQSNYPKCITVTWHRKVEVQIRTASAGDRCRASLLGGSTFFKDQCMIKLNWCAATPPLDVSTVGVESSPDIVGSTYSESLVVDGRMKSITSDEPGPQSTLEIYNVTGLSLCLIHLYRY
jgi:hypothetical protein